MTEALENLECCFEECVDGNGEMRIDAFNVMEDFDREYLREICRRLDGMVDVIWTQEEGSIELQLKAAEGERARRALTFEVIHF